MLRVEVDIRAATNALGQIPPEIIEAIARKVGILTVNLQHHIVADKLQGQVLHHRTGRLGRSIQREVVTSGTETTGTVFSSGDVKYAAIHEFGGTIPAHDIVPNKAQALAFMMGGKQVFAKIVHMPDVHMPERSFMRSSLADMSKEIVAGIKAAALEGAQRAIGGSK